jgi:hypothetical protein
MSNEKRLKEIAEREKIRLTWHSESMILADYNLEMMTDDEIIKLLKDAREKAIYGY